MNTIILIYIIPIPPTSIRHCIIAHYNLSLHVIYYTHILCINVLFYIYTCSTLYFFILILDKLLFVTSQRENRAFGASVIVVLIYD